MTPTTHRIREMSFQVVESDIPPEMTVADYRRAAAHRSRAASRRTRRPRLRLQRPPAA